MSGEPEITLNVSGEQNSTPDKIMGKAVIITQKLTLQSEMISKALTEGKIAYQKYEGGEPGFHSNKETAGQIFPKVSGKSETFFKKEEEQVPTEELCGEPETYRDLSTNSTIYTSTKICGKSFSALEVSQELTFQLSEKTTQIRKFYEYDIDAIEFQFLKCWDKNFPPFSSTTINSQIDVLEIEPVFPLPSQKTKSLGDLITMADKSRQRGQTAEFFPSVSREYTLMKQYSDELEYHRPCKPTQNNCSEDRILKFGVELKQCYCFMIDSRKSCRNYWGHLKNGFKNFEPSFILNPTGHLAGNVVVTGACVISCLSFLNGCFFSE